MHRSPLFFALSLATLSLSLATPALAATVHAAAADAAAVDASGSAGGSAITTELDRIVVTATRTDRAIVDVPNTVDVIDRERIDSTLARDIRELFRYEPGISVTSGFGRFGLNSIRIRGLDGNRVRIQTDGILVADSFAIGSFSNANRNFVDLDTVKRVEVVRGPTSSLYGSDALGGVVSFITRDPSDYLSDGSDQYVGFKVGVQGSWNGLFAGATGAAVGERWSGMVAASHRQGQETGNRGDDRSDGSARTAPNPQDIDGQSLLAKLLYAPDADTRFRLTLDSNRDATQADQRSALGFQSLTRATNLSVTGDDRQQRDRISFGQEADAVQSVMADAFDWQIYGQRSETRQDTTEVRRTAATPALPSGRNERREREFTFDQETYGLQFNLHKAFATGSARHALSYGLDISRTRTEQQRNGRVFNLDTGTVSNVVSPDTFPVRDFPISTITNIGVYVQDEIAFADDTFRLVPALRVDHYDLDPQVDAVFAADNPGVAAVGLTETSVSPKLGAVWHFATDWSLFGGYARGFRAPPYNDVNIGFTNLQFGYTAIANPDLKPETSDGLELGMRYAGKAVYASGSVYDNRYHDFIESTRYIGTNLEGLAVYQSQNVASARIRGAEIKAGVDLGIAAGWNGWSIRGAAAYARGDDLTADVPLDSIDPLTATVGLAFDAAAWGAELATRYAGRRPRTSDPLAYRQSSYTVVDAMARWRFAPGARIDVGVFNIFDRTYVESGNMPIVNGASTTIDRYTAPGRNVGASLAVGW